MKRLLVVLAACSHPAAPVSSQLLPAEWANHCADHVEVARRAFVAGDAVLATFQLDARVETASFHPSVSLDLSQGAVRYRASAERGAAECASAVSIINAPWELDPGYRSRTFEGTRVTIDVDGGTPERSDRFFVELTRALDACVLEGRGVPTTPRPREDCEEEDDG